MKLICLGDSLMHENKENTYPQVGWIQVLKEFMKDDLEIINLGRNRISTRTAVDLGIFANALSLIDNDTYVLLGYGHNDMLKDKEERYSSPNDFYHNLEIMVDKIISLGGKPILLTPTYKARFDQNDKLTPNLLGEYPNKFRELAKNKNLLLIDLTEKMFELFSLKGKTEAEKCVMTFDKGIYSNYPDGLKDDSHLRKEGALEVVKIFLDGLKTSNCELKNFIK